MKKNKKNSEVNDEKVKKSIDEATKPKASTSSALSDSKSAQKSNEDSKGQSSKSSEESGSSSSAESIYNKNEVNEEERGKLTGNYNDPEMQGDSEGSGSILSEYTSFDENMIYNYVKLQKKGPTFSLATFVINIILLQDNFMWRLAMLILFFLDYMLTTTVIAFLKDIITYGFIFSYISSFVFLVDTVFAIFIYKKKELQLRMIHYARGRMCVILDVFLIIPYHSIYANISYITKVDQAYTYLAIVSFIRLYHIYLYFSEKANNAGKKHWNYFVAQYIITLVGVNHIAACAVSFLMDAEDDANVVTVYTNCLYFTFMFLSNAGFSDIVPTSTQLRTIAIGIMALGFTLTVGVFIGALTSEMVNSFNRLANLRYQVKSLKQYLVQINIEQKTEKRIMDYYEIFWKKKKGVREASARSLLPAPLQMEICFDINFYLLQCSLLFRTQQDYFLRNVAYFMKHEFYQQGTFIYEQSKVKTKMVCILSGVLEILSDTDNESPILSLGPGTVLGESCLYLAYNSAASVRTATYCELQILTRQDFSKIMKLYPDECLELKRMVIRRIKNAYADRSMTKVEDQMKLNIHVSQQRKVSAMKRVKLRLNNEKIIDDLPFRQQNNCCDMYKFTEHIKKKRRIYFCLNENFPWIIEPNTNLMKTWEVVILVTVLFVAIIYPYYIAFARSFPGVVQYITYILEVIYYCDIYIMLTTSIEEKDGKITTVRGILQRQLRRVGFYLDVFGTIPLEFLFFNYSSEVYYRYKFNRLLKTYRIVKFFSRIENTLSEYVLTIRLIKYPLYILISNYWWGVVMYVETCLDKTCSKDGWFNSKLIQDSNLQLTVTCTQYTVIMAVYFGLSTLSTLGFGDISPGNIQDMYFMIAGVIFGVFVFGYCTAELSASITHLIKHKFEFQSVIYAVENFLVENNMDYKIKTRVSKFFELQWYFNQGTGVLSEQSFLNNAPEEIQKRLLFKERGDILNRIPLFQNCPAEFVEMIAIGARTVVLPPGEVVIYSGDSTRELHIIQEGHCQIIFDEGLPKMLPSGYHFGIRSLVAGLSCLFTIKTVTHVKIISIPESVYLSAISTFPDVGKLNIQAVPEEMSNENLNAGGSLKLASLVEEEEYKKMPFLHRIKAKIQNSFLYLPKYCKEQNEDYYKPFEKLGFFRFLRYVTMPICILPQGLFLRIWVIIRFTQSYMVAILVPYQQTVTPYAPYFDGLFVILDAIAWFDLYLMLFVGYYGDNNQLITHPLKTAEHYVKGPFLLDFILCFPWELFLLLFSVGGTTEHLYGSHFVFHSKARLVRVLQIYRLPRFFFYVESNIRIKGLALQVIKYVPLTLVVLNVGAFLIVFTSCTYYYSNEVPMAHYRGGNLHVAGWASRPVKEYMMVCQVDSWFDRSTYDFDDPFYIYLLAFYWCTSTFVGTGFGDLTAQSLPHLIINLVLIIIGVLFFGFVFAYISSHQSELYSIFSLYQEMIEELKTFFNLENVSKATQKVLFDVIQYRWRRNEGVEPNEILACLHPALHEDCVLHLYEKTLQQVPLFRNVDPAFFRILGKKVREKYYMRKSAIFNVDDVVDTLLIVHRGKVEIKTPFDDKSIIMGIGGIIGNIKRQRGSRLTIEVSAVCNMDTLHISTADFYEILGQFPYILKKFDYYMINQCENENYIMPTSFFHPILTLQPPDNKRRRSVSSRRVSLSDPGAGRFSAGTQDIDRESSKSGESDENEMCCSRKQPPDSKKKFTDPSQKLIKGPMGFLLIFMPHKWFRVVVHPNSSSIIFFNFACIFGGYVNALLVTYQFSFQDSQQSVIGLSAGLDVIYVWNFFLNLHEGYLDRYSNYVTKNRKIVARYFSVKTRVFLDFFANVPFPYLALFLSEKYKPDFVFSVLKLLTLLRARYVIDYYKNRANDLFTNRQLLKIQFLFLWISFMIHIMSCLWYMLACPLSYCSPKSWVMVINKEAHRQNSYMHIFNSALYFIVNISTNTGTGDILPSNIPEILYVTICMVCTKFLAGIFLGDITNIMSCNTSFLVRYEEIIVELRDDLQNQNISDHQIEKMWIYVEQLWAKKRGQQVPRLLDSVLPYAHRCEVKFEVYGKHLRNAYLFFDLDDAFLRQLSLFISPVVFFPGNYIAQNGDTNESMYFIHRGEVEVLTVHSNLTETVHDILQGGSMFGLTQGLFSGIPHRFSFRARTTVDVAILELDKWRHLLHFFPAAQKTIYRRAHTLYNIV